MKFIEFDSAFIFFISLFPSIEGMSKSSIHISGLRDRTSSRASSGLVLNPTTLPKSKSSIRLEIIFIILISSSIK